MLAETNATFFPSYYLLRQGHAIGQALLLFLFLSFELLAASLLLFAPAATVQNLISAQGSMIMSVAEIILIGLPLSLCLLFSVALLIHSQSFFHHQNNWAVMAMGLRRLSAVVLLASVGIHTYLNLAGILEGSFGLQYLQDVLLAHESHVILPLYWGALLLGIFYLSDSLWRLMINLGIAGGKQAQRRAKIICIGFFLVFLSWIGLLIVTQLYGNAK